MATSNTPQSYSSAYPYNVAIRNQFQGEELAILYITDSVDTSDKSQDIHLNLSQSGSGTFTWAGFPSIDIGSLPKMPSPSSDATMAPTSAGSFTPGKDQYNLAIAFRPGTLRPSVTESLSATLYGALSTALSGNSVVVNGPVVRSSDQALVWYCAFKDSLITDATWALKLKLKGIAAAAGTGTRSSQVECSFNQVSTAGGPPFSFNKAHHIDIINHLGHTYAPLFFGVEGSNSLLNPSPATGDEFSIYLETIGRQTINFGKETTITFTFSYDNNSDSKSSYFGNSSQVEKYKAICNLTDSEVINSGAMLDPVSAAGSSGGSSNAGIMQSELNFNAYFDQQTLPVAFNGTTATGLDFTNLLLTLEGKYITDAVNQGYIANSEGTIFYKQTNEVTLDNYKSDRGILYNDEPPQITGLPDYMPAIDFEFKNEGFVTYLTANSNANLLALFEKMSKNCFKNYSLPSYSDQDTNIVWPTQIMTYYLWTNYQQTLFNAALAKAAGPNPNLLPLTNLSFKFSDIQVSGTNGVIYLGIGLQNIPGYWDTNFQIPLHKSASVLDGQLTLGASITEGNSGTKGARIEFLQQGNTTSGKITIEENEGALTLYGGNQPVSIPDNSLIVKGGRIQDKTGIVATTGCIMYFAGDTIPQGWLQCDGSAIPTDSEWADLIGQIGNNVPKLSTSGPTKTTPAYIIKG